MLIPPNCHMVQAYTEGPLLTKAMYFPTTNCHINKSWNSSQYGNRLQGTKESCCNSWQECKISLFSKAPRLALELTQPLSTGVKQTRQDANHISPSQRMSSAIFLFLHIDFMMSTHTISLYFAQLLSLYYSQQSKQFKGGVAANHIMFTAGFNWLKMYHG